MKRTDYNLTIGQVVDQLLKNSKLVFETNGFNLDMGMYRGVLSWFYKNGKLSHKAKLESVDSTYLFREKLKSFRFVGYTSKILEKEEIQNHININHLHIEDFKLLKTKNNDRKIEIIINELEE